jgi:hypothetical protein
MKERESLGELGKNLCRIEILETLHGESLDGDHLKFRRNAALPGEISWPNRVQKYPQLKGGWNELW